MVGEIAAFAICNPRHCRTDATLAGAWFHR
jgi:hypothetical protein